MSEEKTIYELVKETNELVEKLIDKQAKTDKIVKAVFVNLISAKKLGQD